MQLDYPWTKRETTYAGDGSKIGDKLPAVRLIQEWLTLHGFGVVVDGDFGSATQKAVKDFQQHAGLPVTGQVDKDTFEALTAPVRRVLAARPAASGLGEAMIELAKIHLAEHPREVGGENQGPWVRLYMEGNEGPQWAWCAGFACFIMRQAADCLGCPLPVKPTFSCDELASRARSAGLFLSGVHLTDPASQIPPGSIFLCRKSQTDWTHTGLVTDVQGDTFGTIEGNTNDSGGREGYEVCQRSRNDANKDFIRMP